MKLFWTWKFYGALVGIWIILIALPGITLKKELPMDGPEVRHYQKSLPPSPSMRLAPQKSILDADWLKTTGAVCGIIGGIGGAVKIVMSFCKGVWKALVFIFRRKKPMLDG